VHIHWQKLSACPAVGNRHRDWDRLWWPQLHPALCQVSRCRTTAAERGPGSRDASARTTTTPSSWDLHTGQSHGSAYKHNICTLFTRKPSLNVTPTTFAQITNNQLPGCYLFTVSNSGLLFSQCVVTGFCNFILIFQSIERVDSWKKNIHRPMAINSDIDLDLWTWLR